MSIKGNIPASVAKWFYDREWAGGLNLKVHQSTDIVEFSVQYTKNKAYWDRAFAFLSDTDLEQIVAGKYHLDSANVFAIVSENTPKDIKNTKWEAHRSYIDIQYVIKGKETIGVASLDKAIPVSPFNPAEDIGFYDVEETSADYYVAEPGSFFIFFPRDAHRPCIKTEGIGTDKKVVIKIRVN